MYPSIQDGAVFGADGAGVVVAFGDSRDDGMLNQRVFLLPSHGWDDHPNAPESQCVFSDDAICIAVHLHQVF